MRLLKRLFLVSSLVFLFIQSAYAVSFTVRRIEIKGNQRLSTSAVLSYLPIHVGQSFDTDRSAPVIQALYKSGYFSDVSLYRSGDTLIVRVKEMPIISRIWFTGNKKIDDKKLKPVLKKLGLQIGDVYNAQKLAELKMGLIQAYKNIGRYDVTITSDITHGRYNTVSVHVVVKEGITTKVGGIRFIGNHAFSGHTLRGQFTLTTPGLFTFFTNHDLYSPYQLDLDLQSLQAFYLNHGYLEFRILSKKVTMIKGGKRALIVIRLYEGPVYHITGYKIAGKYAHNHDIQKIYHDIHPGQVFSRQQLIMMNQQVADYFANQGYAFPKVNAVPQMNSVKKTVFLNLTIEPGKRVYVRFINVSGNGRTTGKALRYQMRQYEGSAYSLVNINESKRRIANLPYFKNIQVTPQPVPGSSNQVDLNYHVEPQSAGRASIQGGYSDVDGFLYGASISDPNFMGTGKFAQIGFQNSAYAQQYSFGYTNPFYTTYGMSRGFSVYYTHTTPNDVNLDTYTMDTYGLNINYSMPLSEFNYLSFGFGYSHVAIGHVNPLTVSPGAFQFMLLHHSPYNDITGTLGLIHSSLNRAVFPTNGNYQNLSVAFGAPVFGTSLSYYQVAYNGRWYWHLGRTSGFVLHPHVMLGYGDGYGDINSLPFFLNYYGGGIDTLLGYEPNTLGPQNPNDPGNSVGGNVQIFGGVNLIFPNGISQNVSTSLYLGFGNVYQTHKTAGNPGNPSIMPTTYEPVAFNNLRWSAGLLVSWNSPFGVISVGYGMPFNVKPGDQVQQFGFTFGTSL